MTVIAWDGRNLSWDSRGTTGDRKSMVKKARKLRDGRTIVVAGLIQHLQEAKKLLDGRGLPELPERIVEDSTIVVYDNGNVYVYDDETVHRRVRHHEAWGTGCEYALGAMFCGALSDMACRAAAKYSTSCGGKIHTL